MALDGGAGESIGILQHPEQSLVLVSTDGLGGK